MSHPNQGCFPTSWPGVVPLNLLVSLLSVACIVVFMMARSIFKLPNPDGCLLSIIAPHLLWLCEPLALKINCFPHICRCLLRALQSSPHTKDHNLNLNTRLLLQGGFLQYGRLFLLCVALFALTFDHTCLDYLCAWSCLFIWVILF